MNESWLISHQGDTQSILKRYNAQRSLADVEREHRHLEKLASILPYPVPQPLASVAQIEDRIYGLFAYIPGHHPKNSPETISKAARQLVHLHASLNESKAIFVDASNTPLEQHLLAPDELMPLLVAADASLQDASIAEQITEFHTRVCRSANDLAECLSHRHLIHGDFGLSNLIDNGAEHFAIIDWDEMRIDSPLLEVASYCAFAYPGEAHFPDAFVAAYREELMSSRSEHSDLICEGLEKMDQLVEIVRYVELVTVARAGMLDRDYFDMLLS